MSELVKKTSGDGVTHHEATREPARYVTPAVDIYETGNGLTVLADMPGAERGTIEVTVDNNILTIKAASAGGDKPRNGYREFRLMNCFRQFELGEKIDQENIHADYKDGVLKLELPFSAKALPRRIEVAVA